MIFDRKELNILWRFVVDLASQSDMSQSQVWAEQIEAGMVLASGDLKLAKAIITRGLTDGAPLRGTELRNKRGGDPEQLARRTHALNDTLNHSAGELQKLGEYFRDRETMEVDIDIRAALAKLTPAEHSALYAPAPRSPAERKAYGRALAKLKLDVTIQG